MRVKLQTVWLPQEEVEKSFIAKLTRLGSTAAPLPSLLTAYVQLKENGLGKMGLTRENGKWDCCALSWLHHEIPGSSYWARRVDYILCCQNSRLRQDQGRQTLLTSMMLGALTWSSCVEFYLGEKKKFLQVFLPCVLKWQMNVMAIVVPPVVSLTFSSFSPLLHVCLCVRSCCGHSFLSDSQLCSSAHLSAIGWLPLAVCTPGCHQRVPLQYFKLQLRTYPESEHCFCYSGSNMFQASL